MSVTLTVTSFVCELGFVKRKVSDTVNIMVAFMYLDGCIPMSVAGYMSRSCRAIAHACARECFVLHSETRGMC